MTAAFSHRAIISMAFAIDRRVIVLIGYRETIIGTIGKQKLNYELWRAGCLYTLHKQREIANWRASVCTWKKASHICQHIGRFILPTSALSSQRVLSTRSCVYLVKAPSSNERRPLPDPYLRICDEREAFTSCCWIVQGRGGLGKELRSKVGDGFNSIPTPLVGGGGGEEGRGKIDSVSGAKTVDAVLDFAGTSQRFRSRAP